VDSFSANHTSTAMIQQESPSLLNSIRGNKLLPAQKVTNRRSPTFDFPPINHQAPPIFEVCYAH
jgi:hypothetical protein